MRKGLLLGIIAGIALMGLLGYIPSAGADTALTTPAPSPEPFQGSISVSGKGEVTVVPDLAILRFGVSAKAVTVQGAMDQAATAMDRIVAALKRNGVADRDIQTRTFNIKPYKEWEGPASNRRLVFDGYMVTNDATVKIRDMDSVGLIIDAPDSAEGHCHGPDKLKRRGIRMTGVEYF